MLNSEKVSPRFGEGSGLKLGINAESAFGKASPLASARGVD